MPLQLLRASKCVAAAGSSSSDTTAKAYLPTNLKEGNYYIGAIADAAEQQRETDESNNATLPSDVFSIAIMPLGVDLVITAVSRVSAQNFVRVGNHEGAIVVSDTLLNRGTVSMKPGSTR